jgi:predicted NAD/FAD-binding protein
VLRQFEYHHPVFTTGRAAAQARHGELLLANRTSYCGAYWRNGFHEDGVVSALAVVDAIRSQHAGPAESGPEHAGRGKALRTERSGRVAGVAR